MLDSLSAWALRGRQAAGLLRVLSGSLFKETSWQVPILLSV